MPKSAQMMKRYDDKQEAVKQWTHDPCGLLAADGIEIGSEAFFRRIDQNRYDEYARWLKPVVGFERFRGQKVLEIGFGMGTDLFQFAASGAEVYGVDLSPKHLEITRARFERFGLEADLQLADAENLPFEDGTFDAVYTFGVIHHTPDTEKAVAEIHRVLKPGARAVIGVYHKHSAFHACVFGGYLLHLRFLNETYRETLSRIEYREHSDACPLVKLYSRSELRRLLKDFAHVEIRCAHLETTHFGRLQKLVPQKAVPKLEGKIGWYLIAECVKAFGGSRG